MSPNGRFVGIGGYADNLHPDQAALSRVAALYRRLGPDKGREALFGGGEQLDAENYRTRIDAIEGLLTSDTPGIVQGEDHIQIGSARLPIRD